MSRGMPSHSPRGPSEPTRDDTLHSSSASLIAHAAALEQRPKRSRMPSVGSDDPRWLSSQPGTVPVRRATPFVTSMSISRRSARGGLRAPFSPRARRTRRAPSRPPASTAPPPGAGSRVSVTWPCMLYRTRWSSAASRAEALAAAVVSCSSARLGREVRADVRRPPGGLSACRCGPRTRPRTSPRSHPLRRHAGTGCWRSRFHARRVAAR